MAKTTYLKNLDSLIFAVIGFFAIHIFTSYSGIGVSPDSIMYASTAHSIVENGTLITFNGGPLVFFPVFYPFFLSVILFVSRVDTIAAAPVINGLLFALLILSTGYIVSKFRSASLWYKWFILAGIILSPGLLEVYTYLWSETLFIVEIALFILAYNHYLQKNTLKNLVCVSVLVAISCITRYAGVTLIMTGGLMLLLDKQLNIRKKTGHILIFGFTSISLLVANLVLNHFSSGLSTGTREPSITPLSKNLYYTGTVMIDWMGLPQSAHVYGITIACTLLLSLVALLIWQIYKNTLNTAQNVITMFAAVYGIFIPVLATFSRFETLNSRLLSPLYVCLLIGLTGWVPDVLSKFRLKKKLLIAALFIMLTLFFGYALYRVDAQRYDDENDYGVPGYTDDDWNKSQFISFLKTHQGIYKPGVPKYSNADEAFYFFTGSSATLMAHRYFQKDVDQFFGVKHYYFIWFSNLNNTELIGLKDIQPRENLHKLYKFPEGAIYEYNATDK